MKINKIYSILFLVLALFQAVDVKGQTRKQLETQRKRLQTEIKKVNRLLFATQKSEKNALDALKDINQKIDIRAEFIASINKEAVLLSTEINQNQNEIDTLNATLKTLKKEYAEMIFKSYKSKSKQSRMLFVLSSESFQQAYKRLEYIKQYASFRKKQGEEISAQTVIINKLNDSLLFKKQVKDTLISTEKEQQEIIEKDKKNQEKLVSKIKKKEKRYIRDIKKKQKEEAKIAARIDKIIKDAIVRSNTLKGKKTSKGFALTPEAKALAVLFQQNKGKLPWPVDNGLIVRRYGKQAHPTLRGITITSTGLHIATSKGEIAHSVFQGEVLSVQVLSGGKKAVLIQHGNYITTYNNLENVFVKKGDKVKTGQEIGKIFTNRITGKTTLIFVVHKETLRQNPANWILRM
ncbi:MAG: peptidoglycan DD-metalloendopeptidase family protein [Flavobacteriaceae bacterium]|nr:peptidoglycan DD-metalloendopeptidase family protein [Flavobacteriaceae bacterium]